MSRGFSYETFAPKIGVARSTIYLWEKEHKQFSDAKKRGFDACLLFWEEKGIQGYSGGKAYNPAIWIYNMKCRFPRDGWNPRNGEQTDDRDGFETE